VGGLVGGAAGGLAVAFFLARLGSGRTERRLALLGLVLTAAAFAGLLTSAVYVSKGWQTVRQRVAPPPPPTDACNPSP
jgi:choline-glycine betaine transporter